jgi:hypothetical protein
MATSTRSTRAAILEDDNVEEETPAPRGKKKVETEQQVKGRLRNAAERFVLNNHRDEYYAKLEELHEAEGVEYKRILTQEEKDEKALKELLERNPNLKAKILQEQNAEANVTSEQ